MTTTYTINRRGLDFIGSVLADHAAHEPTDAAVGSYADDAERARNEVGAGQFEIAASHARNGAPLLFSLGDDCFDEVPLEDYRMTTLTQAGFVVADGYCIHGSGDTREAAMADARQWMENEGGDPLADMRDGVSRIMGEVYIAPATAALLEEVAQNGGNISWNDWDGVCCTCDEWDEVDDR